MSQIKKPSYDRTGTLRQSTNLPSIVFYRQSVGMSGKSIFSGIPIFGEGDELRDLVSLDLA
ncbi:MAG: hypothetical protein M2R45_00743 [Verrucomicrobia subdivision 3 bacterium]|nr:hypothetical protein [Limisphaerales bacterium]MCS1413150.1 hypothetical protein [Limisphaerales bacterium]